MAFRKQLMDFLSEPRSASWLARELGLKRSDVEDDLRHLLRSARAAGHDIEIVPARCKTCDFTFGDDRLIKPGRCPRCKGTRLFEPMIRVCAALLLIAAVLAAGCGASGPSPLTGLTGTVVRGPITPVCRIDVPCEAPFSAGFTVQRSGRVVSQFRSDAAGQFTVRLDPGAYTVVPDADAPLIVPGRQSQPVTVGDTGLTIVRLTFDTGLR